MMSAFTQRLSRLQCTYSMLSRLSKKRDHPQRLVALSGCKSSTLASYWKAIDTDDRNEPMTLPELIQENVYARNLFLNSTKYKKSIAPQNTAHSLVTNEDAKELLSQDWCQKTDRELLSGVKKLSYNIRYNDERIDLSLYENVFVTLLDRQQKLNNNELMTLISQLMPFQPLYHQHVFYKKFCHQLNHECVKRFMNSSIDNMLALCDILYEMTHARDCVYIWHAIKKLGSKPHKLEPHHLIQVMFFLNVCRKPPINMYELEYRLEQCFDDLTINEIGIAALGFFKTGSRIKSNKLLNRIITATTNNLDHMDNVSIGAIAKLIRHSMQLTEINTIKKLVDRITPIEPRLTLMTLNHIAHATARIALYHEEFLNRLIERLNNELTTARIKDFERFMYVFTTFNIDSSNKIYHNMVEELRSTWYTRRAHEMKEHPHVISRILGFLTYVNVYPTDLIKHIMMPEQIHKSCHGQFHSVSREYLVLDCSLQVEVPHYDGHLLRPYVRDQMLKQHFLNFQSAESSRANMSITRVLQTCQEMFNNTSDIVLDRPLPHFTIPDIIFVLDEQNRLLPIKDHLSKFKKGEIKWIHKEDLKNTRLIALIVGYYGVVIRDTSLPIGILAAKIRQLGKIGYTPAMVSHIEWENRKTQEEKYDYIRQLLFQNNTPESIT
ncbi:uncharacterized protein LOC116846978 [Odontomachus brunneus]|uniref:uncharacterized protein LOC116846978 n=1 Tax=Odontomachus brunneus TaxID=486640 RepID=UPI0013F1A6D3|nr:uncharacterized protein LOC116846978 [Odontomachus brunneus]